jgi:lysophospholipase L1-like esterase
MRTQSADTDLQAEKIQLDLLRRATLELNHPMKMRCTLAAFIGLSVSLSAGAEDPARFELLGDWEIGVAFGRAQVVRLQVEPPKLIEVNAQRYANLPIFNPKTAGWVKGTPLENVRAQETTTPGLLEPGSFVLRSTAEPGAPALDRGKDYDIDMLWGTFGRLTNGGIKSGEAVFASYRYAALRLDSVVLNAEGKILLRQGEPRAAAPPPPKLGSGERLLGNIWLPGPITKLGSEHLFPILEDQFPEDPKPEIPIAEQLLPKTINKLRSGDRLKLLAWGDSVTVGTYVPDWQQNRWQEQFVARLQRRFPKANIELVTEVWGGRNTESYLNEPPGSEHNYREKVLGRKPDLVVSEFVNDAELNPKQVEERYGKLLADFQAIGAEWIILTPHYVRPDWMGLNREREIDVDPRHYVAALRAFAPRHSIPLAEVSRRYGRLWRQGIPYTTLLLNSINHPDARGMKIFADALMELFP